MFGTPLEALAGQLLLGIVNGAFYAILSLGLALIFGMLNVINFAHGAMYMMGAFAAWGGLVYFGLSYWTMLVLGPLLVAAFAMLVERSMLRLLYSLDHIYGLLLTFGITLLLEGVFRSFFGVSGQPYQVPAGLSGASNLGVLTLPNYRIWVVAVSLAVCLLTWFVVERTKLGSYLRAGTENPALVEAFGINVAALRTATFCLGAALAALAGVLAAPIVQISPLMGSNLIVVVFAVVVIGGMGSIMGSIVSGIGVGIVEGLTRAYYPEASAVAVFFVMAIVLLLRPAGLFGRKK